MLVLLDSPGPIDYYVLFLDGEGGENNNCVLFTAVVRGEKVRAGNK
jgi:hypothetical protein